MFMPRVSRDRNAKPSILGTEVTVEQTGRPLSAAILKGPLFDPTSERLKA
jgi:hypothetical protein